MQAQATRTEVQAISATQSLAAVQTLLKAGLGCITFLRNLLPDENFAESHFTTVVDSALPQLTDLDASISIDNSQGRNVNSSKIKTMTRGYSDEADKLLNYLEYGIFDALERQYLRSFIFAIYLDPNDPNNIVEAYTFNFHYHTIPGTSAVVPIMSFGNPLQKTHSRGTKRFVADPVTEATMKGKVPTLRDVKRSVKALLKTLIHATSHMDVLPKRRFATFKAGDAEKDKWFFMTHDTHEVPDRWSIGKLNTGHHSVDVSITSIATYLPSSTEYDDAAFAGTTFRQPLAPSLTPVQEASLRIQQAEKQSRDSDERNVAWSGEGAVQLRDVDGEGEDDPEYVQLPDGTYERIKFYDPEVDNMAPIGLRNETGAIEPLMPSMQEGSEAHFSGVSEPVPTRLQELNAPRTVTTSGIEQTQEIESMTQDFDLSDAKSPVNSSPGYSLNSAIWGLPSSEAPVSSAISAPPSEGGDIDTQMVQDMEIGNMATMDDTEMLDVETQIAAFQSVDSIESCGPDATVDNIETDVATPKPTQKPANVEEQIDNGLRCECSISIHDACCFCEAGCGRWYHVWCMGYHSVNDKRIPQKFICFDCRARADVSWDLIKTNLYPQILSKFRQLALFRRAIKIVETTKAETPSEFGRKIGGDNILARQLFKRLETEGFISVQSTTIDDHGFPETRSRSLKGNKSKGKQGKNRKNVQKAKYKFNRAALSSVEYSNYFNPNSDVEGHILGLPELKARFKTLRQPLVSTISDVQPPQKCTKQAQGETQTQTQDESQLLASLSLSDIAPKRLHTLPDVDDTRRPQKRVKVSVAHAVDLAE